MKVPFFLRYHMFNQLREECKKSSPRTRLEIMKCLFEFCVQNAIPQTVLDEFIELYITELKLFV